MLIPTRTSYSSTTGTAQQKAPVHWTGLPRPNGQKQPSGFQLGAGNNTTGSLIVTRLNVIVTSDRHQQDEKNQPLIELLRSWRESDDADEQRDTLEYLMRALDEDRPSNRKLFR